MKKWGALVVALAVLCGNAAAKDWGLDEAISDMADNIMASTNLGKGKEIVLMDFADSVETQNYIEEELANKLIRGFTVIDRKNLGILRDELVFQSSDTVDANTRGRIRSVSGAEFVLSGTLRNNVFTVRAQKVQDGVENFRKSYTLKKNDTVLKELEKSTLDASMEPTPRLPKIKAGVTEAVSHLIKKILESKGRPQNVFIYDIMADREELSTPVSENIAEILANTPDTSLQLIISRNKLSWIFAEMDFQASGEVDLNTARERGKLLGADAVIYGNIRPLGGGHRIFLYAVNVESGKFIATHSQIVRGDGKKVPLSLPKKISGLKVESIASDKIRLSWSASDARNFVVTRSAGRGGAEPRRFYIGAKVAIDFNLESETEYCYTVQPRNTAGLGDASEPVCARTYGGPRVGGGHKVTVKDKTEKSVTLSWNKVREALHYNIRRCREQGQECVEIASGLRDTFYRDTSNVRSSTKYAYSIEAVNSAGIGKFPTGTVITIPMPPTNLGVVETFADKVTLAWEDAQKNISYYVIDVSPKIDGFPARAESRTATVSKLAPETKYQIRVKAVNTSTSVDESVFSKPIEVTTSGRPSAPEGVAFEIDSTGHTILGTQRAASTRKSLFYDDSYSSDYSKTVEITWSATPGAEMYFVYKNGVRLSPPVANTKYREDYSALEKGREHTYSISSYNSAGESALSHVSIPTEPRPPVITKDTAWGNAFSIEWERVPGVEYYAKHVCAYTDRMKNCGDTLIPIFGASFKRENLPYSSTFRYCVIAKNSVGMSDCSEEIVIETTIAPPVITKTFEYGADSIRITWRGSEGAAYYKIYRDDEGVRGQDPIGSTKPTSTYNNYTYSTSGKADHKTEWVDKGIEPKKSYYYYVAAVDGKEKESMSKAYPHKTSAVGTLVLRNENEAGDIITGYKIKTGSEMIAEGNPHIRSGQEVSISIAAGAKNYEIQITVNSGKTISPDKNKSFKIAENKETTFSYRATLREQPQPK